MVRFRVDVTLPTGNTVKRPGEILEVEDEHADLWADHEAAGWLVRLPEGSDEPAPVEEFAAEHDTVDADAES